MTDLDTQITRSDIESKFVELQQNVESAASDAADTAKKIGLVALIVIIFVAYLLGRRRGRAGKTVVEVRRV